MEKENLPMEYQVRLFDKKSVAYPIIDLPIEESSPATAMIRAHKMRVYLADCYLAPELKEGLSVESLVEVIRHPSPLAIIEHQPLWTLKTGFIDRNGRSS
jgi:hypothetical protein